MRRSTYVLETQPPSDTKITAALQLITYILLKAWLLIMLMLMLSFSTPIGQTIPCFKPPAKLVSLMTQGQAAGAQIRPTRATKNTVSNWLSCLRALKLKVKQFTKRFGRHYVDWRKQQILALQRKRQRLLRISFPPALLATHLPRVEQQIQVLQKEVTSIAILKAERTWRERGEMKAGCLKRSATTRAVQRSIPRLWDPDSGDICSSRTRMLDVTQKFYTKLYSPEPVCSSALDAMVSKVPSSCRLSKDNSESMASSFLLDEILDQTSCAPKISSPGTDSLSYTFLQFIFKHPNRGYKRASIFFQRKIFTHLLNARLVTMIPPLVSPCQSDFMKERFIADNGALAQIAIEQASLRNSDEVSLLCDQGKAYDRDHPTYLQTFLNCYGFPSKFTSAITSLFCSTSICVNANGYLTLPISLGRGLRQGGSISPLLFSFVLEPLVKSTSDSPAIRGFSLPSFSLPNVRDPLHSPSAIQPLKTLAYVDDLLLFLRDPADLEATQQLIRCYNLASNAKMNFDKTIAFSVSGLPHPHWPSVLATHDITKWYNRRSIEPLTYLGYSLVHSTTQHQFFQDQMINKIARACDIHKQRNLSFRGRATCITCGSACHQSPFFFPPVRRGLLDSSKPSICSTLFKAFDALLDPSAVSMALKATFGQPNPVPLHLSLTLPLSAVISWSLAISIAEQRSFDSLLVSDAFVFDDLLMCLRPKVSTVDPQPVMIGRYRVNKLMCWISSGAISLIPFFALHCLPSASCPPLNGADDCFDSLLGSLLIEVIDTQTQIVSPKLFRRARRTRILRSFPSSSVVHTRPASFWDQLVPLAARNP
ncbi:hypothetical protein G6F62_002864 [Rhizopus arrhizus]|nr:hypothetical protein G6F24_006978 [Rhizopus arrhizus]KAG0913224.1 hypothetical protein G6F33_005353 [Rhizopus arrhizus]KAG0956151.1 hypothetical protein G6F32_002255 [Rhizopus arrhizus]KAG1351843.1 hypothetical protein G6F62_002864 [Rhizopus arrhizus]KAG1375621.1 hypothetical protein G6F61_008312 [Rhizopus arrhizus]